MNRDHRIYRRSTLLQLSIDPEILDGLEVTRPVGPKDERFQLITSGLQLPACSLISRTEDDVWYIDTGVDNDLGRIYIGERDFVGMASVAGYVSKSSVSRVYEENERMEAELELARALIVDLRTAVAGLVGAAPLEGNKVSRTRKRTDSLELESLGDDADSSDLDLDQI